MEIPEEELEKFFKSGIIETIGSIMEKTKNESIQNECDNIFTIIQEKGKTHYAVHFYFIVYFIRI